MKQSSFFFFFLVNSTSSHALLQCSGLNSVFFRRKFSDSIAEMLVVCATTVHRVGLQTAPNELCPRVPLMAWNTCAFTIQAIGTAGLCCHLCRSVAFLVLFFSSQITPACLDRKHFAGRGQASLWVLTEQTGWTPPTDVMLCILCKKVWALTLVELVSLLQLAGLKAIVQFSATQRLMSFRDVIPRHFTDMLGGTWFIIRTTSFYHFPTHLRRLFYPVYETL